MKIKLSFLTFLFIVFFNLPLTALANNSQQLLKQFHSLGITHCDEFISKNIPVKGQWKFFLTKHEGGLDGPSTEVSMVQIHGEKSNSLKNNYTFIQTLKKCFLHKTGSIHTQKPCSESINSKQWKIQYNLPDFDYKRYKNSAGIVLYTKPLSKNSCLLEYDFRSKGNHSVYKPFS